MHPKNYIPQYKIMKKNTIAEKYQKIIADALVHHERENQNEIITILELFNTEAGFFVEVGANDPFINSVSYPLERIGWHGVLIDPLKKCYDNIVKHRPGAQSFHCACVGPNSIGKITLHAPDETSVYASTKKNVDDFDVMYTHSEIVDAVTLESLLLKVNAPEIDLLLIDTEGTELDVLKGIDLKKRRPKLIIIEDKLYNLEKHQYLLGFGFKIVKRAMVNSWYVPKESDFLKIQESFTEKIARWRKYNPASVYFRNKRREKKEKSR